MKKLLFRILAFIIDVVFVNIIIIGISNISFINHNISEINKEADLFTEYTNQYYKLLDRCEEIFYDNYIDYSESMEIQTDYKYYIQAFFDIQINSELDPSVKDRVINDIKASYQYYYDIYNCKINKYNLTVNSIGVIISLLYFGVFEWYLNGRTIGKLIFRLRTVDNNDINKKIPLWKYIFKATLISGIMFTIASMLCAYVSHPTLEGNLNAEWYSKVSTMAYNIQYVYNTFFLLMIILSNDERSVHDKLLGIRVALFDKNKKEVKSRIFNEKVNNKAN